MRYENNGELTLQSTVSELKIQPGDSVESTACSESRRNTGCTVWCAFAAMDAINHTLILLVTSYLLYHAATLRPSVTDVHVILCTIGYVLLMSQAILVLAGGNVLTSALSRRANKHVHWVLQALGLICNLVGVGYKYNAKTVHFRSTHAIMGVTSIAILCVLAIFGYPVMIAVKLRKYVRPITIKLVHNFLGTACYVIGMAAQCYGYRKKWLYRATQVRDIDTVLLVLTTAIILLSLRSALLSLAGQTLALVRLICPYASYNDVKDVKPSPASGYC